MQEVSAVPSGGHVAGTRERESLHRTSHSRQAKSLICTERCRFAAGAPPGEKGGQRGEVIKGGGEAGQAAHVNIDSTRSWLILILTATMSPNALVRRV